MAKPPAEPLSGAYLMVDVYHGMAVPVEHIHLFSQVRRVSRDYKGGKYHYTLCADQELSMHIITADHMTAMEVAAKLEESNKEAS